DVSIAYNTLSDLFEATENNLHVQGMLGKNYSGRYFTLKSFYDYNKYSRPNYDNNHSLFSLSPAIVLVNDGSLSLDVGARVDIDNTFISAVHFYPEGNASYTIGGNIIAFFASLSGGVEKNTLRSMTLTNPYMATDDPVLLLRYSNNQTNFHGGVKG